MLTWTEMWPLTPWALMAQFTGTELLRISTTFCGFEFPTGGRRETITSTCRELRDPERGNKMLIKKIMLVRTFWGCMFSPTESWSCWMQLDHVDLRTGATCWSVDTALHFLWLQVRGYVVVREEHCLQLARGGQRRICNTETKLLFWNWGDLFSVNHSDSRWLIRSPEFNPHGVTDVWLQRLLGTHKHR